MWVNPRIRDQYPEQPAPTPPEPTGRELAAFPRKGPDGLEQELRIVLDCYQGRDYIAVRLWQRDRSGAWWPLKGKGVSVRLSEAEGASEALRKALRLVEADADRRPTQRATGSPAQQRQQGRRERPSWRDQELPPAGGNQNFDEFGG
jgi:hypothetical protein